MPSDLPIPLTPAGLTRPAGTESPVLLYLARLAPTGRRSMTEALYTASLALRGTLAARPARLPLAAKVAEVAALPWDSLRYGHLAAVRAALIASDASAASVNKTLAALRGVLKEAWRLGLMTAEDYQRAIDVERVRAETLPRGRAMEGGELLALVRACRADETAAGARDAALFAVLYGAGLRRAEVVSLDLDDYNGATGALTLRTGKGRKARTVYATNGGRAALHAWLAVRGAGAGPLFVRIRRGGHIVEGAGLTPQAVRVVCERRAAEAGVRAFSPHDLRRSFVSDMLDAGADISTVKALAGHASVETTARYDRRVEETKKRAAELLHFPYGG